MSKSVPKIKVCGITRESDLDDVLALGVDYIGLNLYEPSPRSVSLEVAQAFSAKIPEGMRVMVDVATEAEDLKKYEPHFDFFQIHFPYDIEVEKIRVWSEICGRHRLWLAPKIPPDVDYPDSVLNSTDTILVDTYKKDGFGGSGQTGNWARFASLSETYPEKTWILAGGLAPDNIEDAVKASKTSFVDVNSGVETEPGIKDADKLRELINKVRA